MSDRLPLTGLLAPPTSFASRSWTAQAGTSPAGPDDYALGYEAGRQDAAAQFATERAQLLALVAASEAAQPAPAHELAHLIAQTVALLVEDVTGTQPIDPTTLRNRAALASALIAEAEGEAVLYAHPDDLDLLAETGLPLRADPSLSPGDFRLQRGAGLVEDGVAVRLAQLRNLLGITH